MIHEVTIEIVQKYKPRQSIHSQSQQSAASTEIPAREKANFCASDVFEWHNFPNIFEAIETDQKFELYNCYMQTQSYLSN